MKLTSAGLRRIIFEERRRLMEETSGGSYNFRLGADFLKLKKENFYIAEQFSKVLKKIATGKGEPLSTVMHELEGRLFEDQDQEIDLLVFGSYLNPEKSSGLLQPGRITLRTSMDDDLFQDVFLDISRYNLPLSEMENMVWDEEALYGYLASVEPTENIEMFKLGRGDNAIDRLFRLLGDRVVILN
jgi:hypothetical protein